MKIGALLALLTLLLGFGLGALFRLVEDSIKEGFLETAKQTLASSATDVEQEARSLTGRAWTYMKRAASARQRPGNLGAGDDPVDDLSCRPERL